MVRRVTRIGALFFSLVGIFATPSAAQPSNFEHVVLIVQENRTPDNLFYALCATEHCSTNPNGSAYDIQTKDWLDNKAKNGVVNPGPVPLANDYDPMHSHADFLAMCDLDQSTNSCRMDGAAGIRCVHCPRDAEFKYVDNSSGIIAPYLTLATQYGWANYMFQTNEGDSFPAHQFLFGATSAPNKLDDHVGTFASENVPRRITIDPTELMGCISKRFIRVQLINSEGKEYLGDSLFPCFEHRTLADVLGGARIGWRYYTPGPGSYWTAPVAIRHVCEPKGYACTGPLWQHDVALTPLDVLSDLSACKLRGASWVIPSAQFSDHAKSNTGGGPAWVAGIVNAIGNSSCHNSDGSTYWQSTAIVIVWDDWGGWYDHEAPPQLDYQGLGFRVPLIVVSPYARTSYVSHTQYEFGSILKFVEDTFDLGRLGTTDVRANSIADVFNFKRKPRTFTTIDAKYSRSYFVHEKPSNIPVDTQ